MEAEILFLSPAGMEAAMPTLRGLGFEVEILDDRIDDFGPTIWCRIRIRSELGQSEFLHWVLTLVDPHRGDVYEAGYAQPPAFA